jgi:hypothetical protein
MPSSILEAIKMGMWDFEPTQEPRSTNNFSATEALPGTEDKLQVLAERVRLGLPLWHEKDRIYYGQHNED